MMVLLGLLEKRETMMSPSDDEESVHLELVPGMIDFRPVPVTRVLVDQKRPGKNIQETMRGSNVCMLERDR